MRIRLSDQPLPSLFSPLDKHIVHEARIKLSAKTRLQAKVLVFDSRRALRAFFRDVLNRPVCKDTAAVCTALSSTVYSFKDGKERHFLEVDPRYFCLMGFIRGKINVETVVHECIHAGFAHQARKRGLVWDDGLGLPEEEVCYPAGKMSSMLLEHFAKESLLRAT